MNMKRAITSLASGIFLLCMVSQAQAVPMTFAVNAPLTDGGSIAGTIELDTDLLSGMPLTAWNLTTSGGTLPGNTYSNTGTSTLGFNTLIGAQILDGNPPQLILSYSPGLMVGQPVPSPLTVGITEITASGVRAGNAPVVATPEPGTVLLFGTGLLGLGLRRYRRKLAS